MKRDRDPEEPIRSSFLARKMEQEHKKVKKEDLDEEDELDAYMSQINKTIATQVSNKTKPDAFYSDDDDIEAYEAILEKKAKNNAIWGESCDEDSDDEVYRVAQKVNDLNDKNNDFDSDDF